MKETPISTATAGPAARGKGLGAAVKRFLADAAYDWNLSPKMVVMIMILPFIVAFIGASTALIGKDAYKWFVTEDGFAESLQVVFYLMAFVFSLVVSVRHWRTGDRLMGLLYLGLAGALFFLIGEELSWGQRIFGWQTADTYVAINKQDETNLHNVYGVGAAFKWIQLLVGAFGTIPPLLVWRWNRLAPYRDRLWAVVPHYTLIAYFAMMFVWRIYRNLLEPPEEFYFVVSEYNEVLELVLAMGFFFFLIFQFRRLGRREYRGLVRRS